KYQPACWRDGECANSGDVPGKCINTVSFQYAVMPISPTAMKRTPTISAKTATTRPRFVYSIVRRPVSYDSNHFSPPLRDGACCRASSARRGVFETKSGSVDARRNLLE